MNALENISIRRVRTVTHVVEALTDLILRGEIRAGEHLPENVLQGIIGRVSQHDS